MFSSAARASPPRRARNQPASGAHTRQGQARRGRGSHPRPARHERPKPRRGFEGVPGLPIAVETVGWPRALAPALPTWYCRTSLPAPVPSRCGAPAHARYLDLGGSLCLPGLPDGPGKMRTPWRRLLLGLPARTDLLRARAPRQWGQSWEEAWYTARKALGGALGYPVTAEACNRSGYCSQSFQYGPARMHSPEGTATG